MFKGNNFSNRRGVIGCALSHYYIWKELIKDNNNDFYVILEDDIELCNNFSQQLKKIQCDLKSKDMVLLGYHMHEQKREQHREYNDSNIDLFIQKLNKELYIGGFFMYSINKSGARKMIKYIEENGVKYPIDNIIYSLELYETVPHLSFSKWNENGVKIDTDIQHDYSYDSWLD
jgi:GR25 family glycosyltransferase involved in LPS biosynthesis